MQYLIIIILLVISGFLFYASAFIGSGVYVKALCRMPVKEKQIALTFDDGPDAANTPRIAEILDKHKIPAVFFCIGKKIEGNEHLLESLVRKGHLIGNHTYEHAVTFPLFSAKKMKLDLQKCEHLIAGATRQKELSLFRPPFGVTNPRIGKAVKQSGYQVIGWSIRSLDTMKKQPEAVIRRVTKKIKPGSIILFHDPIPDCPKILEAVIDYALKEGYTFVRADKYI